MKLEDAGLMLDHEYMPLESGWLRLEDGQGLVAARTQMMGCTGKMIDWWFSFVHHTEEYLWWHPRDHTFSDWIGERQAGRYVGGTHLAREFIGDTEYSLKINFRDPANILDTSRFAEANVSTAVYARIGAQDEEGYFGHLLHMIQELPEGCVMRSRFWLGYPEPEVTQTREQRLRVVTDEFMASLHKHSTEEMAILAGFLPTVHRLYNAPSLHGEKR